MFALANTGHFILSIPTVRNEAKMLAFEGTETISNQYAIKVELVSEHPGFDLESLLCQPVFLQFGLNGEGIRERIEDVSADEPSNRRPLYLDIESPNFSPCNGVQRWMTILS